VCSNRQNQKIKIMGLDVDYIAAKNAINELQKLVSDQPHGEREKIADEIIEFVEQMKNKWKT